MSFWRTFYHLVWATKNREPLITAEVEARLHAYLVRKAAELGVFVYAINSCTDHVHMVVAIPPKHAVADVVKHLKGASSHDVNTGSTGAGAFAWQRGYGVLSLGERQLPDAKAYVDNQKENHGRQTINARLERDSEDDEAPTQRELSHGHVSVALRETVATYDSGEEAPF